MKMRLSYIIFVCLFIQGLTYSIAEEESPVKAQQKSDDSDVIIKAEHRESDQNGDQLALESGDQEPPPKTLAYNSQRHQNRPQFPYKYNKNANNNNNNNGIKQNTIYNGPPPPPPKSGQNPPQSQQPIPQQAMDKYGTTSNEIWPAPIPDMPKIISLDVKCEKNLMKVYLGFDKPFYGIVFSKGHYSNVHCVHLPAGLGRTTAHFEIGIHACGTSGNTENGLYGYGAESGSGTFFENIIVIQYDPQVQEVWDQARKLRCTWHDQYEKSVTFRPFPVDMLDVVRTDFAGDNVGCWMQIQVGKGPWASEVSGLVKIGQTMTMVLAIKDDDAKFDMLVRNCMAHDGKRAPIQLVDQKGCVTRPKLMSRFTKIKNFGASATVLSYAHFQAFKFPDSMEVHFQCTIQICRYQCPAQCSDPSRVSGIGGGINNNLVGDEHDVYGQPPPPPPLDYLHGGHVRDERRMIRKRRAIDPEKEIGLNRVIRVVSTGDLTFSIDENNNSSNTERSTEATMVFPGKEEINPGLICMTAPGFAITLIILLAILLVSCLMSAFLCLKLRPFSTNKLSGVIGYSKNNNKKSNKTIKTCFYS